MKTQKLLLSLLLVASFVLTFSLALSLVSADIHVKYNVYEGIVEDNGLLTKTSSPVNDYAADGYLCLNAECSQTEFTGLVYESGDNGNSIIIYYPTELISPYGYAIYFHKDGFIGWEQYKIKIYGDKDGVITAPSIYLSKLRNGWAPIQNLQVVNKIAPNKPLEIGLEVGIDAETYAAIKNVQKTDIELTETVKTRVDLKILDKNNQVVYEDSEETDIPYSEKVKVYFSYDGFSQTGDYRIIVSTEVIDEKIMNSITQSVSAGISVIEPQKTDYAYSIINNLVMEPAFPEQGKDINFKLNYFSNYVDASGKLIPIDTKIQGKIYFNGEIVYEDSAILKSSSNIFEFVQVPEKAGNYKLVITGTPYSTSIDLSGKELIGMSQEIAFAVKETPLPPQPTIPIVTITSPINGKTYDTKTISLQVSSNQAINKWEYSLNGAAKIVFSPCANMKINAKEGENNIKVYATNENGTGSKSVSFSVKLIVEAVDNDHDGFNSSVDCNDNNSAVHPQALEICNSIDDDCDGQIDEGSVCVVIDTQAPVITIISPEPRTYNNTKVLVSFFVTDNVGVNKIWYNWNGVNISYSSPLLVSFPDNSSISLKVYASDVAGNVASKNIAFRINTSAPVVDNQAPILTNITTNPVMPFVNNGSSQNITINFNSNEYPINATISLYNSTSLVGVPTVFVIRNASQLPITYLLPANLSDGNYSIRIRVSDSLGNSAIYPVGSFSVNKTIVSDDDDDDDNDDTDNDSGDRNPHYETEEDEYVIVLSANLTSGSSDSDTSRLSNLLSSRGVWNSLIYWLILLVLLLLILIVVVSIANHS